MKRTLAALLAAAACAAAARAQNPPPSSQLLLVLPFENTSKAPGLDWIGESFPEVLNQRLQSATLYPIRREDRQYAFDHLGVPTNARLSRATLLRVAEGMDADLVVFGSYSYDGQNFRASAQLMEMKRLHMSPAVSESGPLTQLLALENGLAWDLLRQLDPALTVSRNAYVAAAPAARLDAFEAYVRASVATSAEEKIKRYHEALRLNPGYTQAMLHLGETYYEGKDYESAAQWLAKIPADDPLAREANFYLGLAAYYRGDWGRAEQAFQFVAERLPLTEVYNNLGVVAGRRGQKTASRYFQRAVESDPNEPDYHFNLGVALYREGDKAGAVQQLKETLRLNPEDGEAKSLLEAAGGGGASRAKGALERIKLNYDETSFQQLAMEIENVTELRLSKLDARSHAAYHVERGEGLLAQGLATEAEKNFREAIELDPTQAGAHRGLSQVLEQRGDLGGATAEARAAARLKPSAEAFVALGRLELRDNKPEAASRDAETALTLEPGNPAAEALKRDAAARSDRP